MVRPLEKRAAREVLFLLAVFFALLVVARFGHGANDVLELLVSVIARHARQLRDRVVRDEHAVVGPAPNLLDHEVVEEASAQVRSERRVEVHALEQRAGGHLDADTGDGSFTQIIGGSVDRSPVAASFKAKTTPLGGW